MTPDGLWLLRHGELPPNPQRRFVGQRDLPLSATGRAQARRWGAELAAVPFAAVFCSDLQRCRETAMAVAAPHALPILPDASFREIHLGDWEGLRPADVERRFPGQYALRGEDLAGYRPQGGESFADLARRALSALARRLHGTPPGPVLLVAHGGVNRCLLAHYLALPLGELLRIPQPYAACTALERAFFERQPFPEEDARQKTFYKK